MATVCRSPPPTVERDAYGFIQFTNSGVCTIDTALLEWVSEFAVRAYTTANSAVSYLNHAQIAYIDYAVVCFIDVKTRSQNIKSTLKP